MFDLAQASDVLSITPTDLSSGQRRPTSLPAAVRAPAADLDTMREERLPFIVTIASDDAALRDAVAMRQAAYGRHLPDLAATLSEPEPSDREPGPSCSWRARGSTARSLAQCVSRPTVTSRCISRIRRRCPSGWTAPRWPRRRVWAW